MRLLLIVLLLSGMAWAKPRVLLITPGLKTGTLESRTFLQVLEHAVEQRGQVNLVHPHAEDPRWGGLSRDKLPSAAEAQAAAQRFQADYVVTLDVRFEHKIEKSILTVVGVALVTVDNLQAKDRKLDDPVVFHSEATREPVAGQTQELTVQCARDLAEAILTRLRK